MKNFLILFFLSLFSWLSIRTADSLKPKNGFLKILKGGTCIIPMQIVKGGLGSPMGKGECQGQGFLSLHLAECDDMELKQQVMWSCDSLDTTRLFISLEAKPGLDNWTVVMHFGDWIQEGELTFYSFILS